MNKEFIIPESIDFVELLDNSKTLIELSKECASKTLHKLSTELTEAEQKWYVANLYISNHYDKKNDYPIDLQNVFKFIGFANKGNAMQTVKNNLTKDKDYKIIKTDKKERIMLNQVAFKYLCIEARTEKGKEIREYYKKIENVCYQMIIDTKQVQT
jgi:hypothetical protein